MKKYKDDATQELLDVASCLDPRFKMDFISADNKPRVKAKVASEMMECQEEMASCSTEVEHEVAETSQAKKAKKSFGSFFKLSGAAAKCDSSVTLKAELSNYLLTPSIGEEQDPLEWWKTHRVSFPHLQACPQISFYSRYKFPVRAGFQWQHNHLPTFKSQACNGGQTGILSQKPLSLNEQIIAYRSLKS